MHCNIITEKRSIVKKRGPRSDSSTNQPRDAS